MLAMAFRISGDYPASKVGILRFHCCPLLVCNKHPVLFLPNPHFLPFMLISQKCRFDPYDRLNYNLGPKP